MMWLMFLIVVLINWKIARGDIEFISFETGAKIFQVHAFSGKIQNATFSRMNQLEELTISSCNITELQEGALCIPKIQSIRLLDNTIDSELRRGTFSGCDAVENLTLINNNVRIGQFAFSGLTNLRNLHLSRQNVPYLTNSFFFNLSSLKRLNLQFCNVRKVISSSFDNLNSLEELTLVHNQFETISGVLHKLINLENLTLANNKLQEFPWEDLKGLHHIANVDLSSNLLGNFDVEKMATSLENVVHLEIWGNPVNCPVRREIVRKLEAELPRTLIFFDVLPNGTCLGHR